MAHRLLPLLLALALVAACGGTDDEPRAASSTTTTTGLTTTTAPACTPAPLEDRAATVIMVGIQGAAAATDPLAVEVASLGVGGVMLTDSNVLSIDQARTLVADLRAASPRPLLVSVDEEGGRVSSLDAVVARGPSARRLGTAGPPAAAEAARALGGTLATIDVDVALAPVADVDAGPAGGIIGDRSFGGDPAAAAASATAFASGLREAGVAATAKHFPGHGRAPDSHDGPVSVDASVEDLRRTELVPFDALVADDVPLVMLGHVEYSGLGPLPASLNPAAYELLRSTGFDGVAVTDSLGMGAINLRWPFPEAAVRAVVAGADVALATQGQHARAMRDELVSAVQVGRLPETRLDEAVTRVLRLRGEDPATMVCP